MAKETSKHCLSVMSRYKQRIIMAHQHSEMHPHRNAYWTASCDKHGTFHGRNMPLPLWIKCKWPENRRERKDGGCPKC